MVEDVRRRLWYGPALAPVESMLWTSFVTLLSLWLVALATSFTLSGFVHLLPLMAAVVALLGTVQARPII